MIVCDVEILAHMLMLLNVKRQLCCFGIPAVVKKKQKKNTHFKPALNSLLASWSAVCS